MENKIEPRPKQSNSDPQELPHVEWVCLIIKLVFYYPLTILIVFFINIFSAPLVLIVLRSIGVQDPIQMYLNMVSLGPIFALPLAVPFLFFRHRNREIRLPQVACYGAVAGIIFSLIVEIISYCSEFNTFKPLNVLGHLIVYVYSFVIGALVLHSTLSVDRLFPHFMTRLKRKS